MMNTFKFIPAADFATERHNPSIDIEKTVSIFDKEIRIKVPCNLSIFVTDICPNRCPWCINRVHLGDGTPLNLAAVRTLFKELSGKGFEVTITGGEPMFKYADFVSLMQLLYHYDEIPCRTVSTTGLGLLDKTVSGRPVCWWMVQTGCMYNINVSLMSLTREGNEAVFQGSSFMSLDDLAEISTYFRINGGELRVSCNLAPHATQGVHSVEDVLWFVSRLSRKGIKSFIFRVIDSLPESVALGEKIRDFLYRRCELLDTIKNDSTRIDVMSYSLDEEYIVKIYQDYDKPSSDAISTLSFRGDTLYYGYSDEILAVVQ